MAFYIESKNIQMNTWEVKLLTKARKFLLKNQNISYFLMYVGGHEDVIGVEHLGIF